MQVIDKIKDFYSDKPILKNLTYMLLISIVLIWMLFIWIALFTNKGEAVVVPDFTGLSMTQLEDFAEKNHLEYEIVDSIFFTGKPKGSVVSQTPLPNTKVKAWRKVYLTIVSFQPEKMPMPNFKDLSLRQAKSMVETYGLKLDSFRYVPSQFKDAVLDQYYKGRPIAPGTPILKGAVIELIIGDGMRQGNIDVPFLYGMTLTEAQNILSPLSLSVGATVFEGCDSSNGRIYKQTPECVKYAVIRTGQSIDLYFKSDEFDFEELIEQKTKDTVK